MYVTEELAAEFMRRLRRGAAIAARCQRLTVPLPQARDLKAQSIWSSLDTQPSSRFDPQIKPEKARPRREWLTHPPKKNRRAPSWASGGLLSGKKRQVVL